MESLTECFFYSFFLRINYHETLPSFVTIRAIAIKGEASPRYHTRCATLTIWERRLEMEQRPSMGWGLRRLRRRAYAKTVYTETHTCAHAHTRTRTHTKTYIHTHKTTHTQTIHTHHAHTRAYTCTHTHSQTHTHT